MISGRRLKAIVVREFNEIIRDPLYLVLVFLVPPFIMMIFGAGLVLDVEHLPLGVVDRDQTPLSRQYIDTFDQSESFDLVEQWQYTSLEDLNRDLRTSKIRTAIVIPEGFERDIRRGRQTEVQLLMDGTIPVRSEMMQGYGDSVNGAFIEQLMNLRPKAEKARYGSVEIVAKVWFNEDLRSANFVVPGVVATTLMYYPALLTTLSIVREKESQSILALHCSPISKAELLLGKLLPYLTISVVNVTMMLLLMAFVFGVPVRGSLPLIGVASVVYIFATCSLGMMISVLVKTQVTAILATLVLTVLPSFLYSGFFTPLASATWSMWIIGRFIPATYYLDTLRGACLKGTGWEMHWPSLVVLMVYGTVLSTASFFVFKKRLD
jgi:ABC-2 type transport system permease protein